MKKGEFSTLALGALHFGSLLNKEESKKLILYAMDQGINLIDTAPLYGRGQSEAIIGEVLSETNRHAYIATKVGLEPSERKDHHFGVQVFRLNYENIKKSIERSLKKLRKEAIDLLILHAFDEETPLDETIQALYLLYKEGILRSFGCSNYNPQQLRRLLRAVKRYPALPFVVAQCHYNILERRASRMFAPLCEINGIQLMINRALARGALTGKYVLNQPFPEKSRAVESFRIRKWLTQDRFHLLQSLEQVAKEYEISLTTLSLAWIRKRHPTAVSLIGARTCNQLEESLKSTEISLHEELYQRIELLIGQENVVLKSPPRYFEK